MTSAKIINFPRSRRRRSPLPPTSETVRYIIRPYTHPEAIGFGLLLSITILAAFFYLSGSVHAGQHDALYTGLLVAVWGLYFASDRLLRIPMLGTVLRYVAQLLLFVSVAGFFGFVLWLVLSHP